MLNVAQNVACRLSLNNTRQAGAHLQYPLRLYLHKLVNISKGFSSACLFSNIYGSSEARSPAIEDAYHRETNLLHQYLESARRRGVQESFPRLP